MRRAVVFVLSLVLLVALALVFFGEEFAPSAASSSTSASSSHVGPGARTPATLDRPAPEAASEPARAADEARSAASVATPTNGLQRTSTARVTVRVVADETGAPVARASVRYGVRGAGADAARPAGADSTKRAWRDLPQSGDDGRVVFDGPVDAALVLEVSATLDDVVSRPCELDVPPLAPGEAREVVARLRFTPDGEFYVRALDRATRAPIANVRVLARPDRGGFGPDPDELALPPERAVLHATATDANGLARVPLRSWQRAYLELEGAAWGRRLVQPRGAHATPESALDVELAAAARLTGRLVGADAGEVCLRTSVFELYAAAAYELAFDGDLADVAWCASLRPDGEFAFEALPPECDLRAEFHPADGAPVKLGDEVRLEPGETRRVEWSLAGTCVVQGRVLDAAGTPVAATEVWLVRETNPRVHVFDEYLDARQRCAKATTDDAGRFEFDGVRAGAWQLGPAAIEGRTYSPPDAGIAGTSVRLDVAPTDRARTVELRVDRDLFLEGRVVGPDGAPVEGAYVFVRGVTTQDEFHATTVEARALAERVVHGAGPVESRFRCGPLVRDRYRLVAYLQGFGASAEIEAEPGAKDLVLTLTAAGTIRGRVADDGCGALPVEVHVSPSGARLEFERMVMDTLTSDFTFSIEGLAEGEYDLFATCARGHVGARRAVAVRGGGTTELGDVTLGASAHLRLRTASGKVVALVRSGDALVRAHKVEVDSPFECRVPPGRVRIELARVERDGLRIAFQVLSEQTLDVAPGETKELVLEPPK